MVPGKARLTRTVWPAFWMTLPGPSKIASWRRVISGRLTGQWLVTCDVVSAPVLHLRHLLSGAEMPGKAHFSDLKKTAPFCTSGF
jgi:hypothetical protein